MGAIRADLLAGLLRTNGCVDIAGALTPEHVAGMRTRIEALHADERAQIDARAPGYERFAASHAAGGVMLLGHLDRPDVQTFAQATVAAAMGPLADAIHAHFGEAAAVPLGLINFRRHRPRDGAGTFAPTGFHQDCSFLGPGRALNLWLALDDCGDTAPGLEVLAVKQHADMAGELGGEWRSFGDPEAGSSLLTLDEAKIAARFPDARRIGPRFRAGDGVLFDQFGIHRTYANGRTMDPRISMEIRCFPVSGVPATYAGWMPVLL
jgi:Phytanoyl-CoA dioxygenase (PhyH)